MSIVERHILVSRAVAGFLPAPLRDGAPPEGGQPCAVRVLSDLVAEATRLYADKASTKQLVLFLAPSDLPGLAPLTQASGTAPRAWAGIVVDTSSGGAAGASPGEAPWGRCLVEYRSTPLTAPELSFLLERTWRTLSEWTREAEDAGNRAAELSETSADLEALVRIGQSLSQEKDQERLLRTILSTSKQITGADAGSITLVEKDEQGARRLRFKYSHTFSKDLPFEERVMPYNTKSLAGYVAVTGRVLNIPDAYALDPSLPYSFNRSFDTSFGYRTRSILVVPMRNHIDEVIGVIQLLNCKEAGPPYTGNEAFEVKLVTASDYERLVVPFQSRYESLMQAVASQAAIAIENNRMIAQIQGQFEQFVRAAVTAIDSRDPPTSGHSVRVAQMCLNTARAINAATEGPFGEVRFNEHALRELELAGLLHDFGKVYIDAGVFLKAKKLFPADFAYLMLRLEYLYRCIELQAGRAPEAPAPAHQNKLESLKSIMELVKRLNEPSVLTEDRGELIRGIRAQQPDICSTDLAGNPVPLLTDPEAANLEIPRGTLNAEERQIIQGHVEHTYTFVDKIPWPTEFAGIPRIARAHHERLDGSGYPDGLKGKEAIPLQARIMAVADVYDALAASDRPYKKALPREGVFAILRKDAAGGGLDADIVELFIAEKACDAPRTSTGGAP